MRHSAILCATNMREMGALEIARIIHADSKNANLPVIALGDGSQRALMEAFQAGCERLNRPQQATRGHCRACETDHRQQSRGVSTHADAFPVRHKPQRQFDAPRPHRRHADARARAPDGRVAHQRQRYRRVLFYDAGTIAHAECGNLFGDEAVIHILKSCGNTNEGVLQIYLRNQVGTAHRAALGHRPYDGCHARI